MSEYQRNNRVSTTDSIVEFNGGPDIIEATNELRHLRFSTGSVHISLEQVFVKFLKISSIRGLDEVHLLDDFPSCYFNAGTVIQEEVAGLEEKLPLYFIPFEH